MRRVYIHIGIHKTGSSSIQHALYDNARPLLRHGYLYPRACRNHSDLTILFRDDPAQDRVAKVLGLRPDRIDAHCVSLLARLTHNMAVDHNAIILSGEGLSLLSRAEVGRLAVWLGACDFHIIAYVREPRAWASSAAQERVKAGRTLQNIIAHTNLQPRFRERLAPWLSVFGRERLSIVDFNGARAHDGGITGHFADWVGLPKDLRDRIAGVRVNESLSAEAVHQLSEWNRSRAGRVPRHVVKRLRKLKGASFALPHDVLNRIEAASAADTDWLRTEFAVTFGKDHEEGDRDPASEAAAIATR